MLSILQENGKDTSGLTALINLCIGMEKFAKQAENKIADMESQLENMKEAQDHPIRAALQNTIKELKIKVAELRENIAELKSNIIEGCKNGIAAFKERGAAALDKLASLFKIKSGVEAIKNNAEIIADNCDKSCAKIEEFSKNYHTAGRALKNMARMIVGRKPIDAVKESGKLAKAVSAPYKAEKAIQNSICKQCDKIIAALNNLEKTAEVSRDKRSAAKSEKPSLLATLEANEQKSKQQFAQKSEPGRDSPIKNKHEAEV